MEHINIISKTKIIDIPFWIVVVTTVVFIIIATTIISLLIKRFGTNPSEKQGFIMFIAIIVVICFYCFTLSIMQSVFKTPTGKYRYEATIDKENMTISEYEEFIDTYHPYKKGDIYVWEGE